MFFVMKKMFKKLYNLNCIKTLLELDCIIHGSVLCSLIRGISVEDHVKSHPIFMSCSEKMRVYVERFLKPSKRYVEFSTFAFSRHVYEIQEQNLQITIVMYTNKSSMPCPAKTNIDLICLSRDALFVQKQNNHNSDLSLGDLLEKCNLGVFQPLTNVTRDRIFTKHILDMIKQGWLAETSSVSITDKCNNDACAICHETLQTKQTIVTECKHFFHTCCWLKLVEHSTNTQSSDADFSFPPG